MHEIDLVRKIVDIIADQAERQGLTTVAQATISLGKMNGIGASHFTDYLSSIDEGPLANTQVIINEIPVELFCNACGNVYVDGRFDDHAFAHATSHAPDLYLPPPCPECGKEQARVVGGREMRLVSIEGD